MEWTGDIKVGTMPGEIRLNGKIYFDPNKEQYMADAMAEMSAHHTISSFLERLVKIAFDNPEYLSRQDKLADLMNYMRAGGLTPLAEKFYSDAKKDIAELKQKVNAIYDMCLSMYTLARFGKTFSLEDRTKNIAISEFMLERQISQICDRLGINDYSKLDSGSYLQLDNKSADILQYIIEHYSNVVKEIKETAVEINIPIIKIGKQEVNIDIPSLVISQIPQSIQYQMQDTSENNKSANNSESNQDSQDCQDCQDLTKMTSEELRGMLDSLDAGDVIDFGDTESGAAYNENADLSAAMQLIGL